MNAVVAQNVVSCQRQIAGRGPKRTRRASKSSAATMTAGAVAAPRIIAITRGNKATSKNHIDTDTLVCIQSDTGQARLLYTLDGSKPAREAPSGSGSGGRRYLSPFLLPGGRVCVRAVAATSDGRESATVTKVFIVREAEPSQQEAIPAGRGLRPEVATSRQPQGSKVTGDARSLPRAAPPDRVSARSGWEDTGPPGGALNTCTHFPRCPIFCLTCGTLAKAPADGGQPPRCVWCHAQVPVNARACSRGHAPGQQKLRRGLQAHVSCACCGRGTPAELSRCLTCDARLRMEGRRPHTASEVESAPCVQDSREANPSCSTCGRVNRSDARYCDWCGTEARRTSGTRRPSGTGRPRAPRAAVSPGRGYWRMQVDHVCAHLRSFAQNDAPFRTLLGEPRLGRITSAVLREDGREVSLTLGFAAAEDVGRKAGEKAKVSVSPSSSSRERTRTAGAAAIDAIDGHCAVPPLLLQRGADIDRQSGP
ncbi:double zinc ribbon and ankyrin repeat-containing protein 1 isoform X2 [Hippocampus zosterae]|uniref:double zinc ribbon and ankyrin repeat-containing protein 1 isoform X2 n=1 Tax=Hippocampus zosterae TaxID=109293 RepID=UPI00223CD0BF|nr:double zinc ribbon and ankyrin repeat-containing protein 1 isoform X2 [Hippocampus zosterae]